MVSLSGSLEKYDTTLIDDNKDITWYLERCGGMDYYNFDNHDDAYDFGRAVRDLKLDVDVEINFNTVRIYLPEYELKD